LVPIENRAKELVGVYAARLYGSRAGNSVRVLIADSERGFRQ